MQDIDFDEIDRAVNSVTTSAPDVPVAPVTPVAPAAELIATPSPAPASPAVRRSSGRFMDVVHSSSDMRPTRSSAPAAHSLHRDDTPDRTAVAERPQATTVASSAFHWPDPIDVTPVAEPTAATAVVEPFAAPLVTTPAVIDEPAAPLESPFLPDAKIEKRPLGAFSSPEIELPFIEEPINATVPAVNEEPAELQDEILLLEEHIVDEPEALVAEEPTSVVLDTPAAPAQEEHVGPTSITQQYKEHPTTEPQESGAIFDTESYHQPLVHTPKKRSGALVVVWILALILVGGGIGAAVYFVLLPMLG